MLSHSNDELGMHPLLQLIRNFIVIQALQSYLHLIIASLLSRGQRFPQTFVTKVVCHHPLQPLLHSPSFRSTV